MRPLFKILAAIEAIVLLGAVSVVVVKRTVSKASHAPVGRMPMPAVDQKALERAKAWTVLISNEGFEQKSRGTGMLIDSTHVLTADHMIPTNGNEMWIYVYPGKRVVHGKATAENSSDDLAIIELDEKVELPAYATFQETHYDGDSIIILGNILGGMKWYVSYGIISGDWAGYVMMDGTMTHGDSGGPWINAKGEVVGMSDWQLDDEEPEAAIKGGVSAKKMKAFISGHNNHSEPPSSETYNVRQSGHTKRRLL